MLLNEKNLYSEEWTSEEKVEKYHQKFNSKVDFLRHRIELDILKQYAKGDFLDCSIGDGRFINGLKDQIRTLKAMDYSLPFLNFVKKHYPFVEIEQGDLEKGIPEPNNAYDTVICLRTLFALRNFDEILKEMVRITKPGGTIIFDYGVKKIYSPNKKLTFNSFNAKKTIQELNLQIEKSFKLDGFTYKIKTNRFLHRLFNNKLNIIPENFYEIIEKIISFFAPLRKIYIIRIS